MGAHKREVHIIPVPCDICNKKIKPGANMKKHMDNMHNRPIKNTTPIAQKRKRQDSTEEYSRSWQYKKAKHLTDELASSPGVTRGVLEKIVKKIYRD